MLRGYFPYEVERAWAAANRPKHCEHCFTEFECRGRFCGKCKPFYQVKEPTPFEAMQAFRDEWAEKLEEVTAGRFTLELMGFDADYPDYRSSLRLVERKVETVEAWDEVPALDELVAVAMGECRCDPLTEPCGACQVMAALVHGSDELPF